MNSKHNVPNIQKNIYELQCYAPQYNTGTSTTINTLLCELGIAPHVSPSQPNFDEKFSKQIGTMDGIPAKTVIIQTIHF